MSYRPENFPSWPEDVRAHYVDANDRDDMGAAIQLVYLMRGDDPRTPISKRMAAAEALAALLGLVRVDPDRVSPQKILEFAVAAIQRPDLSEFERVAAEELLSSVVRHIEPADYC